MTNLCCDVLAALKGRSLTTAESCTGGLIGAALTDVPGSSAVYKGGIICYSNEIKRNILHVEEKFLDEYGAVSEQVAHSMASNVRELFAADVSVSVTGLAGPGGDEFGNPVGTVYIGYSDSSRTVVNKFSFTGDRNSIRLQAAENALKMILFYNFR